MLHIYYLYILDIIIFIIVCLVIRISFNTFFLISMHFRHSLIVFKYNCLHLIIILYYNIYKKIVLCIFKNYTDQFSLYIIHSIEIMLNICFIE